MSTSSEGQLSQALDDLVSAQPFEPDPGAIESRARYLRRRSRLVRSGLAAGALAAAIAPVVSTAASAAPGRASAPVAAARPPALSSVADYILRRHVRLPGNATLVIRSTEAGARSVTGTDLYADNGEYFFAPTPAGLPAQVAAGRSQGGQVFAWEIKAAVLANGDALAAARQAMAEAPLMSGSALKASSAKPERFSLGGSTLVISVLDNHIWENSLDALIAGAQIPQVRAGVLRLLATLPGIHVTAVTVAGQPALTLTAASPVLPGRYQESLTIGAASGFPLVFTGGITGGRPSVSTAYRVSRVTLAQVAAGKVS